MREPTGLRTAVVLTCHDDAETFEETVASILAQEPRVELIVVDDGSSDPAMLAILERLERQGPTVIHQSNQGQAAAAMTGFHATSAPYVMRFDSDDILEPGAVDALARALDAHPAAAAAWGDIRTFGLTEFLVPSVPTLDPWLVTYTNCIPASSLYRRAAVLETGGWQLRTGFEDWDLWMALAERGHTGVYVPRVTYRYRRRPSSRLAEWLPETPRYFEELRLRHEDLFSARGQNRRRSQAPALLKLGVASVERAPRLPRLVRIQLSELLARLLWSRHPVAALRMTAQAVIVRTRARRRSDPPYPSPPS